MLDAHKMKLLVNLAVIGVLITSSLCQNRPKPILKLVDGQSTPGEIVEGNNITLLCDSEPVNVTANARIVFYFNERRIDTDEKIGVRVSGRYLSFERINKTFNGYCKCVVYAIGRLPYVSHDFHLKIGDKPWLTMELPDHKATGVRLELIRPSLPPDAIEQFSDVYLLCAVSTFKIINIRKLRWFLDNTELLPNDTAGVQFINNNSTLKLSKIQPTSSGIYMCKIETNKETLNSNPLPIGVFPKKVSKEVERWLKKQENIKKTLEARKNLTAPLTANLQLGDDINADDIREFDDIYFTCSVKNNVTEIKRIEWYHMRRRILVNADIGIIQEDPNLILKRIPKVMTGDYYCMIVLADLTYVYSNHTTINIKDNLNVTKNATGCYCTSASDCRCGENKVDPVLVVQLAPELHPDTIVEFDNVYLTCTLLPLNISRIRKLTWYHNGKILYRNERVGLLNGNSTLVLPRIEKYYAGSYECYVDTDIGWFESHYVMINVLDTSVKFLPTLAARLGDTLKLDSINEFDNIYFQCDIKPNLTSVRYVRWLRNDKEINPLEEKVDIVTWTSILIVPTIRKTQEGKYQCEVTTKTGITLRSNAVMITVNDAPNNVTNSTGKTLVITALIDHPEMIVADKEVCFHCYIHPKPSTNFSINWFRNGKTLLDENNPNIIWHAYGPHTFTNYKIKKEDVGNYTCSVQVETEPVVYYESVVSAELTKVLEKSEDIDIAPNRTVGIKLTAELQGDPDKIYELDNVYFYCDVQPNTTDFNILTWYRNGGKIDERKGNFIPFGERTLMLPSYKIEPTPEKYSCEIVTYEGTLFESDPTPLLVKPYVSIKVQKFEQNPADDMANPFRNEPELFAHLGVPWEIDNIHENDDLYFTCSIRPDTIRLLEINWFLDEIPIHPDARSGVLKIDPDLFIYNVAKEASGSYTCRADTKRGIIRSNQLYLDVKGPRH